MPLDGGQFKKLVFSEIAAVMSALADPTRLALLELLCQCPRNVESLARLSDTRVTTVSHHLHVLKRARLVTDSKEGRFVFYSAAPMALKLWDAVSDLARHELSEVKYALAELAASERDGGEEAGAESVSYQELIRRVRAGEAVLLDVRPREEYEAAHVPGAVSVPLERLEQTAASLPRDRPILAYCRGRYCVLSHEAVRLLERLGYPAERLPVGVAEWKAEGAELESIESIQREESGASPRTGTEPQTRADRKTDTDPQASAGPKFARIRRPESAPGPARQPGPERHQYRVSTDKPTKQ